MCYMNELGQIHPHTNLDEVPEEGSLIYNIADMPKKKKNKHCEAEKYVHIWPKKPATDVQLKKHMPLHKEQKYEHGDFSISQSTKDENTEDRWSAKSEIRRLCKDKNCQSTRCYKNMSPRRPIQSK